MISNIHDNKDNSIRQGRQCHVAGKVRNYRNKEEYIGFYIVSSSDDQEAQENDLPANDSLKHGFGITKFPDGRVFEGTYDRGAMLEGKMTYPGRKNNSTNGTSSAGFATTYHGGFDREGRRCGRGIYTTATTTFLGEFYRDEMNGSGILMHHKKDADINNKGNSPTTRCRRFVGHWKNGKKHGKGRELLGDGTVKKEGLWEEGRFRGAAVVHKQQRVSSPTWWTECTKQG